MLKAAEPMANPFPKVFVNTGGTGMEKTSGSFDLQAWGHVF
jgi:hypothetical protein